MPQEAAARAQSEPTDPDPNVVELAETLLALPSTWTPLLIGAVGIAAALTRAPRRELARVFPTALVAVLMFVVFGRLLLYGFGEFLLLPLSGDARPASGAFAGAGLLALLVSAGAWVMLRHRPCSILVPWHRIDVPPNANSSQRNREVHAFDIAWQPWRERAPASRR